MIRFGSSDSLRIGVFVCHCGRNIAGYLDTAAVSRYAAGLPGVVHAVENHYTCSEPGIQQIRTAIAEHRLNRVVVAACTPRTHEPLFRETCREAGLNPWLFEFVNLREQCSWVHSGDRAVATAKARDLVRMGVVKASMLEPAEEVEVAVEPAALVIGGGVAGMTAALALARRSFPVCLVERENRLGGRLLELDIICPGDRKADQFVDHLEKDVRENGRIEVLTGARIVAVDGFVGNFTARIRVGRRTLKRRIGTMVVATGADVLTPVGIFGYDGRRVITQLELEAIMTTGKDLPASVVMIQCAGGRCDERPYCSKVCCFTAVKNAVQILHRRPEAEVTILYRDLQTHGVRYEELLTEARQLGVQFFQYTPEQPPEVRPRSVRIHHRLLGRQLSLPAEMVVLATPMVPREGTVELAQALRVPLNENGFFLEAHAQLKPVEFATDGVFLCGSCLWPSDISESIYFAQAAAAKASILMARGSVRAEPITCVVDPERCRGCGECVGICEYHAPALETREDGRRVAVINEVSCKGCGTCAAMCPTGAITARQFTDRQLEGMMVSALLDWQVPEECL